MKQYPHSVVGSFILNAGNQILLVKSPKWEQGEVWAVPGGHIEWGETIGDAAIREAKEEVGLDVKFEKVFDVFDVIFPKEFHQKMHFIFFECLCRVKGKPKPVLDNLEIVEAKWFSFEEAKLLCLQKWTKWSLEKLSKRYL